MHTRIRQGESVEHSTLQAETYHNHIKLHSIQLIWGFSSKVTAHSPHLLGWYTLIEKALIVLVDHGLADVHAHDAFGMRSELSGDQTWSTTDRFTRALQNPSYT